MIKKCQWLYQTEHCNMSPAIAQSCLTSLINNLKLVHTHPRRPSGGQSGWEKRRDESFSAQAEKPLGTDSHRSISKQSSKCWLLIEHKKYFVLLCPIGAQHLLSSFREFVHDGYWLDHGLSGSCTKEMHAVRKLSVWYKLSSYKYCLPEN